MYIYIEEKNPLYQSFITKGNLKASRNMLLFIIFIYNTYRCMQIVINWTPRGLGAGYD